jgi:hypothetical protein
MSQESTILSELYKKTAILAELYKKTAILSELYRRQQYWLHFTKDSN